MSTTIKKKKVGRPDVDKGLKRVNRTVTIAPVTENKLTDCRKEGFSSMGIMVDKAIEIYFKLKDAKELYKWK